MKTRNGFVSNSSSSSFILLYKSKRKRTPKGCSGYRIAKVSDDNYVFEGDSNSDVIDRLEEMDIDECGMEFLSIYDDDKDKSIIDCVCRFLKENPEYRILYFYDFYNDGAARAIRDNMDGRKDDIIIDIYCS